MKAARIPTSCSGRVTKGQECRQGAAGKCRKPPTLLFLPTVGISMAESVIIEGWLDRVRLLAHRFTNKSGSPNGTAATRESKKQAKAASSHFSAGKVPSHPSTVSL
jgi:hypothetical protein